MKETGIENGKEGTGEELEKVREEFEAYRGGSVGRRDLPEELWMKAVGLLERYPASTVCRELRLNSQRLNSKRSSGQGTGSVERHGGGQRKRSRGSRSTPDFLELSAGQIATAGGRRGSEIERGSGQYGACDELTNSSWTITIERADGTRLTARLPGNWAGIEALCTRFLTEAR